MNNKPVYTSLYRCGYMSVFLALTYYSSSFAAIILLLLICHFADAALFFSHLTSGLFSSIPYVRPLSLDTLRPVLFFQRPHAWPFLSVPVHSTSSYRPLPSGTFLTGPPAKMEQNPLLNRRYTCKGINKKVKKNNKSVLFFHFF